jgi:hypothetical protein
LDLFTHSSWDWDWYWIRKITSLLKLFSESRHLFFKFVIERE